MALAQQYGYPDLASAARAILAFRQRVRAVAKAVSRPALSPEESARVARIPWPAQERILGEFENGGRPTRDPAVIAAEIAAIDEQIRRANAEHRKAVKRRRRRR